MPWQGLLAAVRMLRLEAPATDLRFREPNVLIAERSATIRP